MKEQFRSILALSADSPEELRPSDVFRVVDEADDLGVKAEFVNWLLSENLKPRTRISLEEI